MKAEEVTRVRRKFKLLSPGLDERMRRLWAAAEAQAMGWGGVSCVAEATGLSRTRIRRGLAELEGGEAAGAPAGKVRRPGAGPKARWATDPSLISDLEFLVDPATRGDPESPLRWTCKS